MIDEISEVKIELSRDYQPLRVGKNGCVGELNPRDHIQIRVSTEREDVYGFRVQNHKDGGKDVILAKNLAQEGKSKIYNLNVPIEEVFREDGEAIQVIPCTKSNTNNIQLVQLNPEGEFQMWKIALVSQALTSQNGKFFLPVQKTYSGRCFQDENGEVVCPRFDDRFEARKGKTWKSMIDFLSGFLADRVKNLAPITNYKPQPQITAIGLKPKTGRVIFFDCSLQYGAIETPEKGVVNVHWTDITREGSPFAYLVAGELVQYKELVPHTSTNPSEFKYRAIGVKLLS